MVFGVVILRRVIDEELKRLWVGVVADIGVGAQHLSGIEAILSCIHHVRCLRDECDAHADVGIDAGGHRVAALRLNEHHAVGTLGAVEGGGVLQYRHLLDVLRVDVQQHVGVVAVMQRGTCLLHVLHDAVDDEEWLCVGIERVQAAYEHGSAIAGTAGTRYGTHICTEEVLDVGLDGLRRSVRYFCRSSCAHLRCLAVHRTELVAEHLDAQCGVATANADLLAEELRRVDVERCGKGWYFDGEGTVVVGHGGVLRIAECLDEHTGQRLLRHGVDADALYLHSGVGGYLYHRFFDYGCGFFFSGVHNVVIVLCHR